MDEQTTLQPSSYDISADGAADAGYEEEPLQETTEQTESTEPEELPPDGARLGEDGELEFGAEFFGDIKDSPEEQPEQTTQPETPKAYTDDELEQIPFNQWDLSRLSGDVGKYAVIVQRQLQRQQDYARNQQLQNIPLPQDIVEPKQYTPKDLASDALKLACEKLGLEDVDDFDSYEAEHRAAYEMASRELLGKRDAEIAGYQNAVKTWRDNLRYQHELTHRADFNEFNQWYISECQKKGYAPQDINAWLYSQVKQNGNNFGIVRQFQENLYKEFQKTKPAQKPKGRAGLSPVGMRRISRTTVPPVLESTRGNTYAGKPTIRADAFANMTDDEQADALIQLGLV